MLLLKNVKMDHWHAATERINKTTAIEVRTADIEEMGIRLRLTIVDTPGKYIFSRPPARTLHALFFPTFSSFDWTNFPFLKKWLRILWIFSKDFPINFTRCDFYFQVNYRHRSNFSSAEQKNFPRIFILIVFFTKKNRFRRFVELWGDVAGAVRLHWRAVQEIFPGRKRITPQVHRWQPRPLLPLLHSALRPRVRSLLFLNKTFKMIPQFSFIRREKPVLTKIFVNNLVRSCRLRMLDVTAMRKLHKKVNLVPVIAKADSLTSSELQRLKARVLAELKQYDIQVTFPFIAIQRKSVIKMSIENQSNETRK